MDTSCARLYMLCYMDGGDKADLSDLEKDDVVVVAFSGSPYKDRRREARASSTQRARQRPEGEPAVIFTAMVGAQ